MSLSSRTAAVLVVLGMACVPAPEAPSTVLYVERGPPPPLEENIGLPPRPGLAWRRGVWRWSGNDYAWIPGEWIVVPSDRRAWVPGRWVRDRRGWYYVDGHWR